MPCYFHPVGDGVNRKIHHESLWIQSHRGISTFLIQNQGWHEAREAFGARRRFFEDPRSITGYHLFTDWDALIRTMITGELPPEPKVR